MIGHWPAIHKSPAFDVGKYESHLMNMFQSCFVVLAFVSFAFTPPLAANNGLLNGPSVAESSKMMVVPMAPTSVFEAAPTVEVVNVVETPAAVDTVEVVEVETATAVVSGTEFSDAEREALASMSLTEAEAVEFAGADVVVIGLGGLLVIALLVLIILLIAGVIDFRAFESPEGTAAA